MHLYEALRLIEMRRGTDSSSKEVHLKAHSDVDSKIQNLLRVMMVCLQDPYNGSYKSSKKRHQYVIHQYDNAVTSDMQHPIKMSELRYA